MPPTPRFHYFLSDDDHPVHAGLPLWGALLPSCRNSTSRPTRPSEEATITYAEYFKAVTCFLSTQSYKSICQAVSSVLNRNLSLTALREIRIYLEKHGAFYHPARIVISLGEKRLAFVLNVAVSTDGQKILEREYHNLERLGELALFDYLPKVYEYGCIQIDAKRHVWMFLGEWFEGYHEFHISEKEKHRASRIAVWNPKKGKIFLSKEQAVRLYEEATAILAAYFNLETYEQIFSWHHAAGDFVVNMDEAAPRVRLITVRRYERLFDKAGDDIVTIMNALLLFLLNVSIRMRIDRVDGVGELSWIDDFSMEGILRGFFKGLGLASRKAGIPDLFLDTFKAFLKEIPDEDFFDLFYAILGRMDAMNPEQALVRRHLKKHACVYLKTMSRILAG